MSQSWKIMNPTAEVKKARIDVPSIPSLCGKVVSFVSNEVWTCLPVIWSKLDKVLRDKYGVSETFKVAVPTQSPPLEVLDGIANKSHAAIVGLGN
jgi:hypothetical protein